MPGHCEHCMRFRAWDDMEGKLCLRCTEPARLYLQDDGMIYGPLGYPVGQILEPVEGGGQES